MRIVEVSLANVNDALAMDSPMMVAEFRRFLARGDRGYYAYLGEEVVHRSWCIHGPGRAPTWFAFAPLDLSGTQAYLHYCETAGKARGKGIYPEVIRRAGSDLAADGYGELFVAAARENLASRKGIEKAGLRSFRIVRIRVIAGVSLERDL